MKEKPLSFEFNGKIDGFEDNRVYQGKAIADDKNTPKEDFLECEPVVFNKSDILSNNSEPLLLVKKDGVVLTIDIESVKDVTLLSHQITIGTTGTGSTRLKALKKGVTWRPIGK